MRKDEETKDDVTIILPVFRPSIDTEEFLRDLSLQASKDHILLVVDNGNTPAITKTLNLFTEGQIDAQIYRVDQNLGWGGAVLLGAEISKTRLVCWAPTNGKLAAKDVLTFISRALASRKKLVKASRVGRGPVFRVKAIMAGLVHSLMLRKPMWDSGGTPTLAEKSFLLGLTGAPRGAAFDAFVLFSATSKGIPIERIKVSYRDLPKARSSWRNGLLSELRLLAEIGFFSKPREDER